ncbi:MAG: hypothetical protein KF746_09090 [Chitinophagaceae bacterium]|nr:hypothetical protein [Chitinophagaceae bacterium]
MKILFWLYRSRVNKSALAPIMIRITLNTRRLSFTTNLFVETKSWDARKQQLKGNSTVTTAYNNAFLALRS